MRFKLSIGAVVMAAALSATAGGAFAASAIQKECSTKYQAAKAANQLAGQTYNQYYKACAAAAKADKTGEPAPTPTAAPAAAPAPAPAPAAPAAPAPTIVAKRKMPAPMPSGPAGAIIYPTAISPQFSTETPGKQRFHTCLAQYNANKTTNGNGGMKWIEKGGGYYSLCNTRLKG